MQTAQSFTAGERQQYIGVSELAACMGRDRWKTPLDLFNDKRGLVPAFEGNKHTERGNRLEAIAADYFTEQTGRQLRRRTEEYTHPVYSYIRGHIDRKFVGEKRIAEIKCPSMAAFRRLQRDGLPESYIIQANGYLGLSGCSFLTWIVFCADAWDAAIFDIEFDPVIYDASIESAVKFWTQNILTGEPPTPTATEDKEKLEFVKVGGSVIMRDDPAFADGIQLLREAVRLKADADELFELAKGKSLDLIEKVPGRYQTPDGNGFSYSMQDGRKSLDKKRLQAENPGLDLDKYYKQGEPFATFKPNLKGE